jgi:hypothetical protein
LLASNWPAGQDYTELMHPLTLPGIMHIQHSIAVAIGPVVEKENDHRFSRSSTSALGICLPSFVLHAHAAENMTAARVILIFRLTRYGRAALNASDRPVCPSNCHLAFSSLLHPWDGREKHHVPTWARPVRASAGIPESNPRG